MTDDYSSGDVPAGAGKKSRVPGKKPAAKGFFGLLPDWKIDTQALKRRVA